MGCATRNIHTIEMDHTFIRLPLSLQQGNQRSLAGAVWANERVGLALQYVERNVIGSGNATKSLY